MTAEHIGNISLIVLFLSSCALILIGYIDRKRFARYQAAVKFQLGDGQMKFYRERRVKRMWREKVTPQNAAWRLLYANRRGVDKA